MNEPTERKFVKQVQCPSCKFIMQVDTSVTKLECSNCQASIILKEVAEAEFTEELEEPEGAKIEEEPQREPIRKTTPTTLIELGFSKGQE